jgi:hypothetical protein
VFTNPVQLAEKPAIRQLRIGIADTDFADELASLSAAMEGGNHEENDNE